MDPHDSADAPQTQAATAHDQPVHAPEELLAHDATQVQQTHDAPIVESLSHPPESSDRSSGSLSHYNIFSHNAESAQQTSNDTPVVALSNNSSDNKTFTTDVVSGIHEQLRDTHISDPPAVSEHPPQYDESTLDPEPVSPVPTHFSDIPAVREQSRQNRPDPVQDGQETFDHRYSTPRAQMPSIIDVLNNVPATPDQARRSRRGLRSPDLVLPRWQPDAEATYCPICQSQFSIFVRKHHCRKCGRVVCNSCSPHRIIIPYQYIVRPPGQTDPFYDQDEFPINGGERVRLCNPCVPDPNTAPPVPPPQSPQYSPRSHQRSHSGVGRSGTRYFSSGSAGIEGGTRGRSATVNSPQNGQATPREYLQQYGASYHPSSNVMNASQRYHSLIQQGGSSGSHYHQRSLPPPPPLAEEDECPVCHLELPSRTLPNFEARREAHIAECITNHSTYGRRPAKPQSDSSGGGESSGGAGPSMVRKTGMFPYVATEKDCVDDAECTICLEEFEARDKMARLECLCRFHLKCIRAWFEKHPGRCPVHQHDSFGY